MEYGTQSDKKQRLCVDLFYQLKAKLYNYSFICQLITALRSATVNNVYNCKWSSPLLYSLVITNAWNATEIKVCIRYSLFPSLFPCQKTMFNYYIIMQHYCEEEYVSTGQID